MSPEQTETIDHLVRCCNGPVHIAERAIVVTSPHGSAWLVEPDGKTTKLTDGNLRANRIDWSYE